ncbi:unnamed protein product [Lepidochelys olivacea]
MRTAATCSGEEEEEECRGRKRTGPPKQLARETGEPGREGIVPCAGGQACRLLQVKRHAPGAGRVHAAVVARAVEGWGRVLLQVAAGSPAKPSSRGRGGGAGSVC